MKFTVARLASLTVLAAALASIPVMAEAPGDIRVAIVIGNAAYSTVPALANPTNDARAMSETLHGLGFNVIEVRDASRMQMAEAVSRARDILKGKQGVGMLYYAGHGLQIDARNYMVPVDARIAKADDVPRQTVDVSGVVDAFKAAGNRMNILVLDACRDNPFGGITSGKGLAPLDAPSGTFLAYATAPGNVAEDGDAKTGNGLYTQYLLQELKKPQARIEDVFKRVRFAVRKASNGRQIPWESTSLEDDFLFNDGRIVAPVKPTMQQLQTEFDQEKRDWDKIKDSTKPDDFYAFLLKYPNGTITEAVHARLNQLTRPPLVVQGAGAGGEAQSYSVSKFRLGDEYEQVVTWESSFMNQTSATHYKVSYRVTRVEPDRVEMKFTNGGIERLEVFDGAGGKMQSGDTNYDPPQHYVPGGLLQVGHTWNSAYQVKPSGMFARARTVTSNGRIEARERLSLPAGTFNTYRIAYSTRGENADMDGTVWMAPEVPIPIKSVTKTSNSTFTAELVRFVRGS